MGPQVPTLIVVEQAAEDAGGIEAWSAKPVDGAVGADECRRLQISNKAVISDQWVVRHRSSILKVGCAHAQARTPLEPHPRGVIGCGVQWWHDASEAACSGRPSEAGGHCDWKCLGPTGIEQPAAHTCSSCPRSIHLQLR